MTASWPSDGLPAAGKAVSPVRQSQARKAAAGQIVHGRATLTKIALGTSGLAVLLILWWVGTDVIATPLGFVRQFSPTSAFATLGTARHAIRSASPYPGQSAPRGGRIGTGASDRSATWPCRGQLQPPERCHISCISIPADDLAIVVDAHRGDDIRSR